MEARDEITFCKDDGESDSSDNIGFTARGDRVDIDLENPWYGDSETGFGATLKIDLNRKQIKELVDFLTRNFLSC